MASAMARARASCARKLRRRIGIGRMLIRIQVAGLSVPKRGANGVPKRKSLARGTPLAIDTPQQRPPLPAFVPNPPNPTKSRFARTHPKSYLGLHATIGLVLAGLSTWAFFAIADEVPEKGWMVRVDGSVTAWLQAHGTELGETIFVGVSFLGAQVLATLLLVVAITLV